MKKFFREEIFGLFVKKFDHNNNFPLFFLCAVLSLSPLSQPFLHETKSSREERKRGTGGKEREVNG